MAEEKNNEQLDVVDQQKDLFQAMRDVFLENVENYGGPYASAMTAVMRVKSNNMSMTPEEFKSFVKNVLDEISLKDPEQYKQLVRQIKQGNVNDNSPLARRASIELMFVVEDYEAQRLKDTKQKELDGPGMEM